MGLVDVNVLEKKIENKNRSEMAVARLFEEMVCMRKGEIIIRSKILP